MRTRLVKWAEDWPLIADLAVRDDLLSVALLNRCSGRFADPDLNWDGAVG